MQYAVNLPNFGPYADPRTVAGLAADAEAAGWDGLFVWDHVTFVKDWELEIGDPWIILAAVALATERLRLGPMITPLPRRRPSKLARETVTLDRLSRGRLVLGVGLGAPPEDEYGTFGEPTDAGTLAARLDEGLAVLTGLWSGEPFSFSGRHYQVTEVTFQPTPLQRPRIPVWVAGTWPDSKGPFRRAARWDGVVPLKVTEEPEPLTPDEVSGVVAAVRAERPGQAPFEVMVGGETDGRTADDLDLVGALNDAGATWWSEWLNPLRGDLEEIRTRVRLGPPRV